MGRAFPKVSGMANVVDLEAYREVQWQRFRERAIDWLNPEDYRMYYEEMVSGVLVRSNWFERLLVEEALFETLLDGFCMGMKAGRRYWQSARRREDIEALFRDCYSHQADELVRRNCNKYHLFSMVNEWTWLSLQVVFDDCVHRWFHKGFLVGVRRQKIRKW